MIEDNDEVVILKIITVQDFQSPHNVVVKVEPPETVEDLPETEEEHPQTEHEV